MEKIEIKEDCKVIIANKAMLDNSDFFDVAMEAEPQASILRGCDQCVAAKRGFV